MDVDDASTIGARARKIRRRRGMSLEVAAGLAGISKGYLSLLEHGQRGFNRRGLLEDVADALGCSVADLTGQPYLPADRGTADALVVIAEITPLLYDITLDDVPDIPVRPVEQLARWAAEANAHCDEARYALAGRDLAALLTELHVHAATGTPAAARAALAALVEACAIAFGVARQLGHPQLAVQAMDRGYAAAVRLGDPALAAFAGLARAGAFSRLGARKTAGTVLAQARAAVEAEADPTGGDVRAAEALGMTHLLAAQLAGRNGHPGEADTHLAEAADLAQATGERNTLAWHFGPANVAAWSLAIAVERGDGPSYAERLDADPIAPRSAGRRSRLHLDLSRGYAQAEGDRDSEAIRHLDTADRIAPTRVRNDP
ncbi:MAG: helix-turn-helix domain-containing protein, partial [Pseudonocardiaceae bacterium]